MKESAENYILVVDRDPTAVEDIRRAIDGLGYGTVRSAASEEEALGLTVGSETGVIIVSGSLPQGSNSTAPGERIMKAFRAPLIYSIDDVSSDTFSRLREMKPSGYIVKPVQREQLIAVIEAALHCHERERELEKGEGRYRGTGPPLEYSQEEVEPYLDLIGALVVGIDRDQQVTLANRACCNLLGYEREEIVGKNWFENFVPTRRRENIRSMFRSLISGKVEPGERVCDLVVTGGGEERLIQWRNMAVRDRNGRISGTLSSGMDITDQKRLESELRETLEATTDGIWTWNFKTDTLFFSPRYYAMLGYEPFEFPASYESWRDLIHPEDLEHALEVAETYLGTKPDLYENEFRLRTKDGRYRWIRARARVVERDERGEAVRMIGAHEDITERKEAEQELRSYSEKLQEFKNIINRSPVLVFVWRIKPGEWPVEYVSDNVEKVLGYTTEDFLSGRVSWHGITCPEDDLRLEGEVARYLQEGVMEWSQEYRLITGSGDVRWFSDRNCALPDLKGEITHIQGIVLDITERKRAEEVLRESEEQLKLAQSIARIGNWSWDLISGRAAWSDEAYRIFKAQLRTPSYKYARSFIHPDDESFWHNTIQQAIRKQEPFAMDFRAIRSDGELIWVHNETRAVFSEEGAFAGYLGTAQDITERKMAEERLRESEERYRQLVELSPDMILVHRGNEILFINEAGVGLLGADSADQLVGSSIADFVHPAYRDFAWKRNKKWYRETGKSSFNEYRLLRIDGSEFDAEVLGVAIEYQGGKAIQIIVRDITERKRAEDALRESEEQLKLAQSIARIGNWSWDLISGRAAWSDEAYRIFKAQHREPSYELARSYVYPDDLALWQNTIQQAIEQQEPFALDYRAIRSDGELIWVHNETRAVFSEEGAFAGYAGTVQDITERKMAEERLRESEEKYRALVENVVDWVWQVDGNGIYTYVSPQAEKIMGYPVSEIIGKTPFHYMSPDEAERVGEIFSEIMANCKRIVGLEDRMRTRDGRDVLFETNATPLFDIDGTFIGYIGTCRDITERKRAEDALRESEEKFRFLAENMADVVWTTDLSLMVTYMSPSVEKVLGFTPEERKKQALEEMMTPASNKRIRKGVLEEIKRYEEKGLNTDRYVNIDVEYYHKEGHTVWMENRVQALFDQNGAIVGFFGSSRDITDRKRVEDALRESEERYRQLVELSPDMIVVHRGNEILFINEAGVGLLGAESADQLVGSSVADLVHPEYRGVARERVAKLIKEGGRSPVYEYKLLRVDGTEFDAELIGVIIEYQGGKAIQIIVRDITERKRAEEALKRSEESFRTLFEEIRDGILIIGGGRIVMANNAICNFYGIAPADIIGMDATMIVDPEYREIVRDRMEQILSGEEVPDPSIYQVTRPKGGIRWAEVRSTLIDLRGEKVILSIIRDITDKKSAEDALRESEERFRMMADHIREIFWMTDPASKSMLYVSPAYEEIFGESHDELYRNPARWMEHIHRDDVEMVQANQEKQIRGEHTYEEFRVILPDGSLRWVGNNAYPISDSWGNIYRVTGVAEDITHRKEAEEEIRDSLREKEVLLREIHHRVKNNFQVISSLLDLQINRINNDTAKSVLYRAQQRIRTMALVHERLYRSDDLSSIDFSEYIHALVRDLYQIYKTGRRVIAIDIDVEMPRMGINRAIPCGLIINEILSNSLIHAFPPSVKGKGSITIGMKKTNGSGVLSIRDNGVGLPRNINAGTTNTLGLKLVSQLVQMQLKGEMNISRGGGTEFTIRFPL